MPVHPHAYGERPRIVITPTPEWRFIPTHMGNGTTARSRSRAVSVHPHAYGERRRVNGIKQRAIGSSPRIWGTGVSALAVLASHRFIPTHMGNGNPCSRSAIAWSVHPHAYGERKASPSTPASSRGSSPRIWGTDGATLSVQMRVRFIPTHMGNGDSHNGAP